MTRTVPISSVYPGIDFYLEGKWYKRLRDLPNRSAYPHPIRALDINQNAVRDLKCNLAVEVAS